MAQDDTYYSVPRVDLLHILGALESFEAELEQLEYTHDWFVADSADRLASSKQILYGLLGIEHYEYDEDETEVEQSSLELLFD